MPVEAIHLSAFADSVAQSRARPLLTAHPSLFSLGRLGALVLDLPYFERFPLGVMRHLLKRPTAVSRWGDALHFGTPVGILHRLLDQVRALSRGQAAESIRFDAQRLLALALGVASHLAVDASMHPLVNRLAKERAARLADDPLRQHSEVEKFQSVLFHEQRNGFDFMGSPALRQHIDVPTASLHSDALLRESFLSALQATVGERPSAATLRDWCRGYAQFTWLLSSPLGKTLVPERAKVEVRQELFAGPDFLGAYRQAVSASRRALDTTIDLAFNDASELAQSQAHLPTGPIDGDGPLLSDT